MKKIILVLCCGLFLSAERNANAQTATFNYTGSDQTWTVPCGVTTITVTLNGASGGYGGNGSLWNPGGLGGIVSGTYNTSGGTTLNIYVGGVGQNEQITSLGVGGYNGGGNGGDDGNTWLGGGGGGATDIRVGGIALANRIVVAGGGGGGGDNTNTANQETGGPGGCTTPANGAGYYVGSQNSNTSYCGQGATTSTFGAGASFCIGSTAALGVGGNSCTTTSGGGGGGGYYGGGCGCYAGGGGGSSYTGGLTSTITNTTGTAARGNGQVVITWVPATAPTVTATVVSSVSCNGGSNGSAHGTVTGGGTPYTYLWTPSAQTNATATGLSAGTYTIGITDACGHTASASVAITQPTVLAATATTSTNITCNGGSTGATASTVTGGISPYTYTWTGGSTNATATGLTAGSYTLSVTDMNGCSATASTVVTQPNALVIDTTFTTANVLCNSGNTGSAKTVVSGGSSPYTYLWTPGGGSTDSAVGLSAGTYTLMVSDACGASATASATITQPTAIGITFVSTPDNGTTNGTIALTVSGGNSPYTYVWTPSAKTTATISSESAGTYKCIVTDANGCKDSISVKIKSIAGIDGINDNSAQIVVYPNPNNGQFTIESSVGGASSVEIYNLLGEKVFTKSLSTTKGTNTINVGNQPNGVYLYRIISDSGDLLGEGRIAIQK